MMLTLDELRTLMPLLDAGIKHKGLEVFQAEGGIRIQQLLDRLQAMADAAGPHDERRDGRIGD